MQKIGLILEAPSGIACRVEVLCSFLDSTRTSVASLLA